MGSSRPLIASIHPSRDLGTNLPLAEYGVAIVKAKAGEPHFRELEPAERVAAADRAPSTSSVSERSAAVWGRPTWFDSGLR
jgi:hypothetical protein